MKQIITMMLLFCYATAASCQTSKSSVTKLYGQLASGGSNHNGIMGELGLQAVIKDRWVTTLSYQDLEAEPKNIPSNYKRGYTLIFLYDEYPAVDMKVVNATAGRFFKMGRKTWTTVEGGISIVHGERASFKSQPVITDGFFYTSSNYDVTMAKETAVGAALRANINWAFLPYMGLGAGLFANFSSIQSPIGGQIKLMVGHMNIKRK